MSKLWRRFQCFLVGEHIWKIDWRTAQEDRDLSRVKKVCQWCGKIQFFDEAT